MHLDRLKSKYKNIPVTGQTYQDLIAEIIQGNTEKLQNKTAKIKQEKMTKIIGRVSTKEKALILPDLSDVMPSRAISARKSAEKGKLISDSLRDSLTRDIRATFNEYEATGKLITQSGKSVGKLNNKVIQDIETKMNKTFEGYLKKDKALGMPKNIHNIAVTEGRSAINEIKMEYDLKAQKLNPDFVFRKGWKQNRHLSKTPRKGHNVVNGKVIDINAKFVVPIYKQIKGRYIKIGTELMSHPHDPQASGVNVIGCNCDLVSYVSRKKNV
jgi:hypothetical protein